MEEAGCDPVFSEKVSTRVKVRPEFVKAMDFARTIKKAVPHQRVIFTVHEMKRLGRGAAELLTIAEDLRHHDIQLELLTGPLQGGVRPVRARRRPVRVLRRHGGVRTRDIREKSLEGQASARERGRHGGRPKVVGAPPRRVSRPAVPHRSADDDDDGAARPVLAASLPW
ncbi:recombinase family protein [Streptomyces sp. NRRL S-1022]|uniref:recombinase family protein n=1 Tax=Streptomyces sp. NRRL S-1022 TaxID=1463880 RepID=UPI001F2937EB|nr:recombinase family protein [Streptomyces sp. NRRL S-1022]